MTAKKKLAVWKFASCDGCQLSVLDCEEELIPLMQHIQLAYFPEATSSQLEGPYDISLVEGSVTTPDDVQRIQEIRKQSHLVVAIGACATAGGIQALRNFARLSDYMERVYPHPEYLKSLDTSTPISDHIRVDYELRGCPINKYQLLEVLLSLLNGKKPQNTSYSVCMECKRKGITCVLVTGNGPCLGPVTHAGCGALCPAYQRGCYGCFGPKEQPNASSLAAQFKTQGLEEEEIRRLLRTFNAAAPAFKEESLKHEPEEAK